MIQPLPALLIAACSLTACDATSPAVEPRLVRTSTIAPPGAEPGTCWGKHVAPAIVETATEQVQVQPAEIRNDGSVTRPAIYKTETRQAIVRERVDTWFETPCADVQTAEFIATLQRALKARGLFRGSVTGQMDARTRAAIRRYQSPQGLDSSILSLAAARKLGLVSVERA